MKHSIREWGLVVSVQGVVKRGSTLAWVSSAPAAKGKWRWGKATEKGGVEVCVGVSSCHR